MTIYFDMDGTIVNFYGVENWLDYLEAYDTTPYEIAKPLIHFSTLARMLNRLKQEGYTLGIISWCSKMVRQNIMIALLKQNVIGLQNIYQAYNLT